MLRIVAATLCALVLGALASPVVPDPPDCGPNPLADWDCTAPACSCPPGNVMNVQCCLDAQEAFRTSCNQERESLSDIWHSYCRQYQEGTMSEADLQLGTDSVLDQMSTTEAALLATFMATMQTECCVQWSPQK